MPVVLKEALRKGPGVRFGVHVEMDEWHPHIDADELCKMAADAIAAVHIEAITEGRRANDGGAQPDLEGQQGRLAREGKRPDTRGVTAKAAFVTSIKATGSGSAATIKTPKRAPKSVRAKIRAQIKAIERSNKIRARQEKGIGFATVAPGGQHQAWLGREIDRGVEYFFVDGEVEKAVGEVVDAYVEASIE